ncbi:MAG: nicotinamide mononucleotide transporter, partial [Prevotellaceae bacterium]|nr:nicotinamide mononucleotide transporter [Prevotellaceae bacterium]
MDSLTSFFAFFDNSSLLNGVLAFLGTVLGLPYIYLQYKANPKFWPVSAVNALPFIYVNLVKSNFATAALFAYYLFVAVQAMFFSGEKEDKAADGAFLVHNIPGKLYPRLVLAFLLIFGAIYSFVVHAPTLFAHLLPSLEVPTPQTPFADAFATALS